MAKLNFRNEVKQGDVDEAIRLMDYSIRSLQTHDSDRKQKRLNIAGIQHEDQMTQMIHKVRAVY